MAKKTDRKEYHRLVMKRARAARRFEIPVKRFGVVIRACAEGEPKFVVYAGSDSAESIGHFFSQEWADTIVDLLTGKDK